MSKGLQSCRNEADLESYGDSRHEAGDVTDIAPHGTEHKHYAQGLMHGP